MSDRIGLESLPSDGKLSRSEYLMVMTKQDATTAKNKVERAIDPDEKKPSGAGSTTK